ncbi:phage tail tube protein [Salinicola sp. LHM]|uniref:phage tail tube protein n=1 Tax=Salinicola sp. LHM TaxID=3065298 RepID=UPI002ACD5C2E|nr:phage tail tube protein [Salinicola sp. LHM]WQH34035.1 phage tail tube protein [Salinicola sp. LHM]
MPIKWRKRLAVIKMETTYGEGSADMTGATLLEVVMMEGGNPYAGNTVDRERMRDGLGAFEQVNTGPYVERTVRVPLAGSGTVGEPPGYGPLLRVCGFSEEIVADVGSESVTYAPVSESFESLEMWWIEETQQQHITGVRATASITSDSQGLPYLQFQLRGLYQRPEAAGDASGATRGLQAKEVPVNKQNSAFTIDGNPARMLSFSMDFGVEYPYRNLINYEGVEITDRQVSGSTNIEAPDLATVNYFEKVESHAGQTLVPVVLTHGKTAGNIVAISGQNVQLSTISPTDNQGIMHYDLGLRFLPSAAEDDDVSIKFT